jgi:hypothetical protein
MAHLGCARAYLKRHFVPNNSQNGTEMAIRATSKMVIIDPFENEFMFFLYWSQDNH